MFALHFYGTWELVLVPFGKITVGCRGPFTIKSSSDGFLERYKAHLVAKGYYKTHGVLNAETFSLVGSVHLQLDVKNIFLHGDLREEVYMKQPLGFVALGEFNQVCCHRNTLLYKEVS